MNGDEANRDVYRIAKVDESITKGKPSWFLRIWTAGVEM